LHANGEAPDQTFTKLWLTPMAIPSGRTARRLGLFTVLALTWISALAPADGTSRKSVFRIQLDGDKPLETVLIKKRHCKEPYACTQLVLVDGKRRVKLTPVNQRPRLPYHWEVTTVRFRDLTGDGVPEIIWDLFTVGGTGSSPSLIGVHQWNGHAASRIFRFGNGRKPPPGYYAAIYVTWKIIEGTNGGLPEIVTRESLHKRNDGTCCPSAFRVTHYRWDGSQIALVPGSVVIEPAKASG
jgi:hypothetical protein